MNHVTAAGVGPLHSQTSAKLSLKTTKSPVGMRQWPQPGVTSSISKRKKITVMSEEVGAQGKDDPGTLTMLSAESMRMQFISNSATNATSSVGKALETLARKQ